MRFSIAGRNQNVQGQIASKIMEQGDASGGYSEAQRKQVDVISKTLTEIAKQFPGEANLAVSGDLTYSGTSFDGTIEIHANHPSLGQSQVEYKEPESVAQPDGSGNRLFANASAEGGKVEPADVTKVPQPSDPNTTGQKSQSNPNDPFSRLEPTGQPVMSRQPHSDPAVPLGGNR